ncbi:MAG: metal-dependent hydrolase [Leptospirales bacterium]|jgi:inner membrane protein
MASLFAHGFVAASAGLLPRFQKHRGWILLLGAAAAIAPDADVLAFHFGIPYGDPFGHRGATHSIAFAFVLAALLTLPFRRAYPFGFLEGERDFVRKPSVGATSKTGTGRGGGRILFVYFFVCTLSHALLDALTNGGLGVAFFFPFDSTRYFFPDEWRVIQVSPIGVRNFLSERGLSVIVSELKFVAAPWIAALAGALIIKIVLARKPRPDASGS